MEEQPTVQMGGSPREPASSTQESTTPPTIPIDDMLQQQGWPPAPPPAPAYGPAVPQRQGFTTPPGSPPAVAPAAGATIVMGPEPSAPLLAWLAVTDGPGAQRGQVFTLQAETVIGRTNGQIVLANDPYVSAQHAKIRQEPSEDDPGELVLVLYDMASANGTFAGSQDDYRETQVYRLELKDGDHLLIGETTLVFKKV